MRGRESTRFKAVSIDDEPINLIIIEEMAADIDIEVVSFEDSFKAIDYIKSHEVDLVFIDYMMPDLDGIEVIKRIKAFDEEITLIMITAASGIKQLKLRAIEAGADGLLNKPLELSTFWTTIKSILNLKVEMQRQYEAIRVLAKAVEYKEPGIAGHIVRIAHYSRAIAAKLGLSRAERELLFRAAELHDVGKIMIDDKLILKKNRFTAEEFKLMKDHTRAGYEILSGNKSPLLQAGARIALTHHEYYDGSGYPSGLKGEEIPLYGRLVGLADVFDTITTSGNDSDPMEFEKALAYVKEKSGKLFDPRIVEAFFAALDDIKTIFDKYRDRD